jgi:hypothetical protein
MLGVNRAQTGDPLLFGYIALWGPSHELGFHDTPWGVPHTMATGLELLNLYFLRLQSHFLETPAPALLFATLALLSGRRLTPFDRWTLAGCGLLSVSYFAYWHDGYYLGPRFLLPLAPWLALWTARFPAVLGERTPSVLAPRIATLVGVFALLIAVTQLIPVRGAQYRNGMSNLRTDLDSLLTANAVTSGTVLVRESWGAQLIARMWGVGTSRTESESIYRTTDACALDRGLRGVEQSDGEAAMLVQLLSPTRRDSSRLVGLTAAPDTTLRGLPGSEWSGECVAMVREDEAGFALFAPALLVNRPGVRMVRDLHRRPTGTSAPYFLLRKRIGVDGEYEFLSLPLDSLQSAWGQGEAD